MSLTFSVNFSAAHMEAVEASLDTLYRDAETKSVLLADDSGQFISQRGQAKETEMAILAALTAAQLSATQEIAKLVGERSRFKLLHEGDSQSVYVLDIDQHLILVVVFSSQKPLGLVRMVLRQVVDELRHIAADARAADTQDGLGDDDFAKLLVDQLDDMLFD